MKKPEEATQKSKELVKMAVAKAALLQPLYKTKVETIPSALVIGGGLAGMTAALEISNQGYKVDLIEKSDKLGGHLKNLVSTVQGENPKELLKDLENKVRNDKNITIHKNAELENLDGYVGNFKSKLTNGKTVEHGIIIVATGGKEYRPTEYSYGKHPNIMTQQEFDEKLEAGKIKANNIAIIHCVGARDDKNTECGRICCSKSMDSALKIKEKLPNANVYSIFRDIRTYGFKEKSYQEAGENGVVFIRRDEENTPEVKIVNKKLELTVKDDVIDRTLVLHPDIIVLSNAIVADENNEKLAKLLKVPLGKDGFFLEAHVKLRPLDFATEGIYVCGLAQGPKFIDETISQASGAVSRACTVLSKKILEAGGVVSSVDEDLCGGCGTCETICPYNAITVDKTDPSNLIARVNEILCKGCGTCVGGCPEKAISMKGFSKKQILAQISAMTEGS
jgi:heterodisulfide reductase subunit A